VLLELKTQVFGNITLPFLDSLIYKLLNVTAVQADQVIMMLTLV
jgi:hypothetical protein